MVFNRVDDFTFEGHDKYKFFQILSEGFNTGKKLSSILKEKLKGVEISPIGELFQEFDKKDIDSKDLKLLHKYFNLQENKIGSRGQGYYGLFGDMYLVENRKLSDEKLKDVGSSFWQEYDEYIGLLENIKNKDSLYLQYLDNYRNYVLLWSYILFMIKSSNSKNNSRPIKNISFNIGEGDLQLLEDKIKKLIGIYEDILDSIIGYVGEGKIKKLSVDNISSLHNEMKDIFNKSSLIGTRKGKTSLNKYFFSNKNNAKVWFDKFFRNNREEDNLAIMFNLFLDKDSFKDKSIKELIRVERKRKKNEYVLSSLYGGIELALVAKYLGYDAGWINYSVYHLKQNDTYFGLDDIYFSLTKNSLSPKIEKDVFLLDDNIDSGKTMDKVRNILHNNHIPVKGLIAARIRLSEREREELKETRRIKNVTNNGDLIFRLSATKRLVLGKDGEYTITSKGQSKTLTKKDFKKLYESLVVLFNDNKLPEIRKHIALNSYFILPRVEKNNRKVNLFMYRKIIKFRKKFGKEFRNV